MGRDFEATIACPVFTALIVYYIEGSSEHRHHLMEEIVAKPERAYGVRGCLFSFLMPWEKLHADINRVFGEGDVTSLSPGMYGQVDNISCCYFAFQSNRNGTHRCDEFWLAIHRKNV